MSLKRYAYATREWEQRRFYLDYNEYMGRIHPSIGDDFNLERLTRHYAFGSAPVMAEHLVAALGYNARGFCTNGADEGLFHTLLWFRLQWDLAKRRRSPRLGIQHSATYDHVLTFAAGLGYDVLPPEHADAVTADVHYLCSPNNPTGDLVELAPSSAELLIIDRTYDDYMPTDLKQTDLGKLNSVLSGEKSVVVVKSFAKAFPIAEFRLGLVATNTPELQSYFHNVYNQSWSPTPRSLSPNTVWTTVHSMMSSAAPSSRLVPLSHQNLNPSLAILTSASMFLPAATSSSLAVQFPHCKRQQLN